MMRLPKESRKCELLSRVQLFATPWTAAHQAPLSMELSRQEYWSGFLFPSPGDHPDLGSNPGLWHCRQILYHLSLQGSPRLPNTVLIPVLEPATPAMEAPAAMNLTTVSMSLERALVWKLWLGVSEVVREHGAAGLLRPSAVSVPVFLVPLQTVAGSIVERSSWSGRACLRAKSLQSCLTLCKLMDCGHRAPLSTSTGFSR